MVIRKLPIKNCRGAVQVEAALVLVTLMMMIFGIFEYGRLLLDWSLLNNAAREACRYALANNTSSTINSDVQGIVTKMMAGRNSCFSNFTVSISGTHQGTATAVNSLTAGDLVTVTVSGKYNFMNVVPVVHMPASISITSAVVMVCEGGT